MIPRYLLPFDTDSLGTLECDVLVVGSGVAGLSTALWLSRSRRVLLVTKSDLQASTTSHAQGGIAAVVDKHDSRESHVRDTLEAGAGLSDPEATEVLVAEGPARVMELLEHYHVNFDMTDGTLDLAKEGGHSRARVVHARGDATGSEVESALGRALEKDGRVRVMEHSFLVDLLIDDDGCGGALAIDPQRNALVAIRARAVVLASGGMGQVYLVTTNPSICTGDGLAMALRAGARVSDVEFVQFHPTALHIPEEPKFLISEAIRGEGAFLVDLEGDRIMEGVHPLAELAPRDIVVARMVEVMKEQGVNHLYLDVRHLGAGVIHKRFPHIYRHCLEAGIDITSHRIPVSPAAHYMSGGVVTDLRGRTDIPGLYACGEVSCTGVHGANRLASNSLLEGLVFARRIADAVEEAFEAAGAGAAPRRISVSQAGSSAGGLEKPMAREDLLTGALREVMRDSVGMVRSERGLAEALEFLKGNARLLQTGYSERAGMELKNMLTVACLIATAAMARQESRGCHRRRDYPDADDWNWHSHIDMRLEDGSIVLETRPQRSRAPERLRFAGDAGSESR